MTKTIFKAVIFFLCGLLSVSFLLFLSAGTLNYFGGTLLLCTLFIPMFISGLIMLFKAPNLLKKRLDTKEKQKEQVKIIFLAGAMFIFGFICSGLDFRFGISSTSLLCQIVSSLVFLFGYSLYFAVLSQNEFLSRTVKVAENQRVVDTGLYSIVRHPMYTATIIMFLSMPLILGSHISFIIFLSYPVIIAKRIILEEELLEKELTGYKEYKKKVKYRLFPYVW